ncbi:hypothetical protein C8R42DRAFT_440861 [Lentinula raphanica]|nr:hypothetical protein C8R42DRAFT_440861 [Lentinula raphanica]
MRSSNDFESTDTNFNLVSPYEYEDGFNMPQQSIRLHSPLSLSLITELKTAKSEPQHSYSSSSGLSSSTSSELPSSSVAMMSSRRRRVGNQYRKADRCGRDFGVYGSGCEEEDEEETEISHDGYDLYDASPLYRPRTRSPRRAQSYPLSSYSASSPSCASPFLTPLSPSLPYTYSLPHTEEVEGETLPDSNSTDGMEPEYTPSCNEMLRRQWNALAFRIRFSVFRARRRMRGILGKGRKY